MACSGAPQVHTASRGRRHAPLLLILDEMNLAHVERYFADFLSGLESRKPLLPDLLKEDLGEWQLRSTTTTLQPLPRNLFVVGTVNVDETTYMFSPKVLDRAFTFEFRVTTDSLDADLGRPSSAPPATDSLQRGFCDLAVDDEWHRRTSSAAGAHRRGTPRRSPNSCLRRPGVRSSNVL